MVYEYLDHMSDVYIHISSNTVEGIFKDAVVATFEVMLNTRSVRDTKRISISIVADDLEQLLYMWVDKLLYLFDAESFAVSYAAITSIKATGPYEISAVLHGEEYDPSMHGQKSGVKAMTYSLMHIFRKGGRWEAYFVLDI